MSNLARFRELSDFLLRYQEIWKNEIMLLYPRPLEHFPLIWVEDLARFHDDQILWELSLHQGLDRLRDPSLQEFFQRASELGALEQAPPLPGVNETPVSWLYMIPKKQHELARLAPLAHDVFQRAGLERVLDLGGGQGHFAQTLAHHYQIPVESIDMDETVQKTGLARQQKKWPNSPTPVNFRTHRVDAVDPFFISLMDEKTLATGLHTCGALAVSHIQAAATRRATVLNLGCCYHKLRDGEYDLSHEAKERALSWNQFALTLAAGPHRKITLRDVRMRNQVKRFRYALHFLLHDEFGLREQVSLGNCPESLYFGDFASYAQEQFSRLQLTAPSAMALNAYQADPQRQAMIHQMITVGLARDALGRPLEVYLLLDRALWLEECGYQVHLQEVFDPHVSPRNIALCGHPRA